MTNVFRRVIVGMFIAMLVSLYLSVGQKGNKHSLRACVTWRGEFMHQDYTHIACRASRPSPGGGNTPCCSESLMLAVLEWHLIHWIQKLMANFLSLQIMYLWHLSKWIPVDHTFHMTFCTVLGERDQLRVQRVPCTTNFQHLDRNFT